VSGIGNPQLQIEEMYDRYGFSDAVGIPYFQKYEDFLRSMPYPDILSLIMIRFHHQYVLDFIMSTSFIWYNLPADIWIDILARKGVRINALKARDEVGNFADIEFLTRYVNVDGLKYFLNIAEVSREEKMWTLNYFRVRKYSLTINPLDEEDLDGQYYILKEQLVSFQERICRASNFEKLTLNDDLVEKYIEDTRVMFTESASNAKIL
jgi:hypothetical protein